MEEIGCRSFVTPRPLPGGNVSADPEVVILEQPAPRGLRFRYECEGRLAGCLTGVHSTQENKIFPSIQVKNYQGLAVVVVSCVTKDPPYYPHPHRIVGKDGCKDGIYTTEIKSTDMIQSFTGLGIQCVKKNDVEKSLNKREEKKVDPFRTGFEHKMQPNSIDLNVVRLCFQVILLSPCKTKKTLLKPVVSNPIYDKKAHSDLSIHKLSHYTAPVSGDTEVIVLCEKVNKDVQIKFFEKVNGKEVWHDYAKFQPSDIHKQVAISFRTPPYHDVSVSHEVDVWIQLERPSDRTAGIPRKFQFLPVDRDPENLARKRVKFEEGCYDDYIRSTFGPPVIGNQGGTIHVPREISQRPVRPRAKHRTSGGASMVCPNDYKALAPSVPDTNMPIVNPVMPFPAAQFRTDGAQVSHYPLQSIVPSMENATSAKINRDIVNIPPVDYYPRHEDAIANQPEFQMRTAYSGSTLIHSFPATIINNLEQKFPTTAHNCAFPPNVPVLSDESNSSPPSPASITLPSTSGKFNSELQMSVEDATEKLGSLTVDPSDLFHLPSDTSISGTDWHNINPTLPYDSGQNVLEYMVSEGGHTDETLQQAKNIERELAELYKNATYRDEQRRSRSDGNKQT